VTPLILNFSEWIYCITEFNIICWFEDSSSINDHSLLSVADEVSDLFTHQIIDVFAVTETWLDSSIADRKVFPYSSSINLVHNDCNHSGGGVAFLLSSRVKCVFRSDLCEGHMESILFELFPKTKWSMLFCCVY